MCQINIKNIVLLTFGYSCREQGIKKLFEFHSCFGYVISTKCFRKSVILSKKQQKIFNMFSIYIHLVEN